MGTKKFSAKAAIAKGAKRLDKYVPGWADKIGIKKFNIDSDLNCILGQLSKGSPYNFLNDVLKLDDEAISTHGFCRALPHEEKPGVDNFDSYQDLWLAEIQSRRTKKTVAQKATMKATAKKNNKKKTVKA